MRKTMLRITGILCILFVLLLICQLYSPAGWLLSLLITCGTFLYHFLMRLAVGYLVPNRFTGRENWFRQKKWEPGLYERLNVQAWKKHMPTFDPESFDLSRNSLNDVIATMCKSEVVHEMIILFSFLPLFAAIPFGEFPVFLFTSLFAALIDTMFTIMQRYNRPRLTELRDRREARARRHKTEE
ncbi:MAG: hypothetical protein IKM64_10305 [Clostridia bacterium]|nr:hypothetical protein [Clostridia bacterium]